MRITTYIINYIKPTNTLHLEKTPNSRNYNPFRFNIELHSTVRYVLHKVYYWAQIDAFFIMLVLFSLSSCCSFNTEDVFWKINVNKTTDIHRNIWMRRVKTLTCSVLKGTLWKITTIIMRSVHTYNIAYIKVKEWVHNTELCMRV